MRDESLPTEEAFREAYDVLKKLAAGALVGERPNHTLQPTALVHEAYLRLANKGRPWSSLAHFKGIAARIMRQVLVDWARARSRMKRGGGGLIQLTLGDPSANPGDNLGTETIEVQQFFQALSRLRGFDERKAEILELRVLSGMTGVETANHLGISKSTIEREWQAARAWMARFLREGYRDPAVVDQAI